MGPIAFMLLAVRAITFLHLAQDLFDPVRHRLLRPLGLFPGRLLLRLRRQTQPLALPIAFDPIVLLIELSLHLEDVASGLLLSAQRGGWRYPITSDRDT